MQDRLKGLVDAKIAEADRRIAELTMFATELRRVSADLELHTPDGPCDDTCGCTTDSSTTNSSTTTVTLTPSIGRSHQRRRQKAVET